MNADSTLSPGIIDPRLPDAEYHALPIPSSSTLKDLVTMLPGQARWKWDHRGPPSHAMDFGSAVDCLLFTPDDYSTRFCQVPMSPDDLPDWMVLGPSGESKAAKAARQEIAESGAVPYKEEDFSFSGLKMTTAAGKAWRERVTRDGLRVLDADAAHAVSECAQAVMLHPIAGEWIRGAQYQAQVVGEVGGHLARGMLDLWKGNMIADLKTAQSADQRAFGKQIGDMAYHVQAALYCDIMRSVDLVTDDVEWRWIVAESSAPFRVEVSSPAPMSLIEAGRRDYLRALETYHRCTDSGQWPTSIGGEIAYDLPAYRYGRDG